MAADLTGSVALRDLRKSYGALRVLDGVTLSVGRGEAVVVCGPSGCGKSTLLRCVNGLEEVESGTIEVGGIMVDRGDAEGLRKVRRATGLVFQNFNLFPHMTAIENITIAPTKVLGVPPADARDEARALLASVGIPEKADAYPFQLSGGQRQRVAIARALAMKPSVMMFDEPTSALDPEMREEVLAVIRAVHEERGMTMIVVTHEIGFARSVARRAILMDGGRIVEESPAADFFDRPASERARRFVAAIRNG